MILSACDGGGSTDCSGPGPPIGPGFAPTPPEIEIALRTTAGAFSLATEDGIAPLVIAPQGGFILLAGVRARGMGGCIELTAAIRDETDNRIVALEMRPAMLEDDGSGWLVPNRPAELYNWANIAACPNAGLTRDLHGGRYQLEVTARDSKGRTDSASIHVYPTCVEPELMEYCLDVCTIGTSGALTF